MDAAYRLVVAAPPVEDYLTLGREAGLSPRTTEQAQAALPGGWSACHAMERASGQVVGMGRVIGDLGWYFHVIDMAVLPLHQRRGLGDALLGALLPDIRARASADAYVTLPADPAGVRLYERHAFHATAPGSGGRRAAGTATSRCKHRATYRCRSDIGWLVMRRCWW